MEAIISLSTDSDGKLTGTPDSWTVKDKPMLADDLYQRLVLHKAGYGNREASL